MPEIIMPNPGPDGRIQSLNDMGAMTATIDIITKEFLKFINEAQTHITVLEIGALSGNVALEAIKQGNVTYIANDIYQDHLTILTQRTLVENPANAYKIKTITADFPEYFNHDKKFDAILIARVLHFFNPEKLERSIDKLYELLALGACAYIIGITPYVARFASFIPEYEHRLKANDNWPGYVTNLKQYANTTLTPAEVYKGLQDKPFHFLSATLLNHSFTNHGFNVSKAIEFPLGYNSIEWQYNNRENVGLIACKPLGISNIVTHDEL